MAQHSRTELYKIYKGGFHDKAFEHLVDSSLNIKDDGIDVSNEFGLSITPRGSSRKLLSFFEKISDRTSPMWSMSYEDKKDMQGINFQEAGVSRLFLQNGGNIGVNNANPNFEFDVNGLVAAKGYVGSFAKGTCYADGKWHTITALRDIDSCQAYEIFAHINDEGDRRFALTQGLLLISHGTKGHVVKMRSIEAGSSWLWGKIFNRIKLRWVIDDVHTTPDKPKFMAQIKSRTHYGMKDGKPKSIFYRISKMWDKDFEMESVNRVWKNYHDQLDDQTLEAPPPPPPSIYRPTTKQADSQSVKIPSFRKSNVTITKKND